MKKTSGKTIIPTQCLSWLWLMLMFCLWVPAASAQQVTRVGNLLTIARSGDPLATIPAEAADAIDIAVTDYTSFALKPDGTVVAWGSDEYGLVTDAKYVRGAKKIVAGRRHVVALLENGTLYSWGSNDNGLQIYAPTIENATDVVAAANGTGVLKANGDAIVWGNFPAGSKTFQRVRKLEMVNGDYNAWQPILIVRFISGDIQFFSHQNQANQIDLNKPSGLEKADVISAIYGQMMALQADSTIKTWVIRDRGGWLADSFIEKAQINKIVPGPDCVFFIKNNGAIDMIGWMHAGEGPGALNPVWLANQFNLNDANPSVRFNAISVGGNHVLAITSDGKSGPIIGATTSTLVTEVGQPIDFGPRVLLGDSFQWSKDGVELLGPVNSQTGRNLTIPSATKSDSGVYVNTITGNGKTLSTAPTKVIVRDVGAPGIQMDGETIMYSYPDPISVRRAGSTTVVLTTSASGSDKLYYSLDGTNPSWTASEIYTGPFEVNENSILRVAAYTDDFFLQPVYSSPIEISIEPSYAVTVNQTVGGKVTADPLKIAFFAGERISLKAYPDIGYRFVRWSNNLGADTAINLTVSENTAVQALFEPISSYAVSGVETLADGFKIRVVKPKIARNITGLVDAENLLTINPDNLSQNDFGVYQTVDFRSASGEGWPNNLGKVTLPGSAWDNGSVVEVSGYIEIRSPGVYTFFMGSQGGHSITINNKLLSREADAGNWWGELLVRFDKPGYYKTRIVNWHNNDAKRLLLRVKRGISFDGWWDNNSPARNLGVVEPGFPKVVSDTGYDITGVGRVDVVPAGNLYYSGTDVQLTAVPAPGWEFMGWSGDLSGNSQSIKFQVNSNIKIKPIFGRRLKLSTIADTGSSGSIITIPDGPLYPYDSTITLKAIPSQVPASYFRQWSPIAKYGSFNFASVKINQFTPDITGFFVASTTTVSPLLNLTSVGRGRIIAAPTTGSPRNIYKVGDKVRLLAEAYEDSVFDYWLVNGEKVLGATLDLTMATSQNVVAHFLEGLHVVAGETVNGRIQIVPQKAGYRVGETVQVMAIPAEGYLLNRWADVDSREAVRTLTLSGDPGSTLSMAATFVAGVRMVTSVTGRGTIATVPAGPLFYPGTSVTLNAWPDYGSKFVNWGGAVDGVGQKTLVLNETKTVQAIFENLPDVPAHGRLVYWGRSESPIASIPGGSDYVQVSIGNNHALALKIDGTVLAWGNPNGNNNVTTVPSGLSGVKKVAAGNVQSLALKSDGTLVYWGRTDWNLPGGAAAIRDAVDIAAGESGSIVLKADGSVIGIGHADTIQWRGIAKIAGYPIQNFFLGLKRDGTVVAYNRDNNDGPNRLSVPQGLTDVVDIALSEQSAYAVKRDGTVVTWGGDWGGVKTYLQGLTGVNRIVGGWYHLLIEDATGTITTFGDAPWNVAMPPGASASFGVTAGQGASIGIVPNPGLAPEIVGSEVAAAQLEVGDELVLGLGLEIRNGSRWQWQKALGSGSSTLWDPITVQTSRSLRIASVVGDDTARYRVVAANDNGSDFGPEVSVAVVPSGTPLISVNGIVVSGLPTDTAKLRVGDAAVVRVSSRMANAQIRYTQGGAPPTFSSTTYSDSAPVELSIGNHRFRAGAFREGDASVAQSLTLDLEVVPTFAVVTSVGQGEGSVVVSPSKAKYLQGDTVTVTAAPAAGFEFAGWEGINASTPEVSLTLNQNLSPVAKFSVRASYRITGIDAPSQAGWKVVRVVDSTAKPVSITSDINTALAALAKTSAEAQFYSETVPFISYRGKNPQDNWYEVNRVFPGGSQAIDSAQPRYALRATGFVEIPTPGTYTFGAVFSGPFRLRVGDAEWISGWDTWRDARMGELKLPRAGIYPIELVQWDENPDTSQILLFAKVGALPASSNNDLGRFVQEGARFVGDVDRGGLRVWTELPNLSVPTVGTVTGSTGYGVFAGETVTLRAEPAAGWTFVRWEGDVSGTSPTITVTPTKNIQVKPIYSTPLHLSVVGDESGNVHGRLLAVPSQSAYEYGTEVRLEAVADTGYGFEVFLGNVSAVSGKTIAPATFRVDRGSPAVTARFKALAVDEISLMVNSVNGGYVQISPSKNIFKSGDSVTLTAVPAEGYLLDAWDGAASAGRTLTRTITIEGEAGSAQTVGASFVAGVRLNTSVEGRGSVTVTPSTALYYAGTPVTAKATPAYGARFVLWDGVGEGETDRSVALTSTSSLKAVFENMADVPVVGSLVYWGRSDSPIASVPTGSDFVQVSIGNNHALALKVDGTVVAWGNANGNNNVTTVPAGLSGVKKVAAGNVQSLALKIDGTVAYWGRTDWNLPGGAAVLRDAVDIAAGESGSIVLKADGTVVGIGHAVEIQWRDIVKIAAYPRQNIFLGLKKDGSVLAYSRDNDWANRTTVPQGLKDVVDIALSEQSAYAVKRDGAVVVWGNDWGGVKAYVPTLTGVNRIVGGWYHLLIESSSGTVTTFGDAPWNTPMPAGASTSFGGTAGEQASIGIVPVTGLAPEVVGNEPASIQLEVGDELVLGLGLETRNGSRWQWQKASGSGDSTVWSPIVGQTSRRLRVASVGLEDSGRYRVVPSNDNGSDVGPEVSVVVIPSGTPVISVNGQVVQGKPGDVVSLKVGDAATVRLSTRMNNGQIRYTLDGGLPSIASEAYSAPINLEIGTHTVRVGVAPDGVTALLPGVTVKVEVVPTFSVATSIGQGEGSVTLSPSKTRYLSGETVNVKATADPGFTFDGWTGIDSNVSEIELAVSENFSLGAKFRETPTFKIAGMDAPRTPSLKVTRAVIGEGSPAELESSLDSAITLLGKGAGEVQLYSEMVPFVHYMGPNSWTWFQERSVAFPGGTKTGTTGEPEFALRVEGFVEIPNPGSWTFNVGFAGAFRLRVGENEYSVTTGEAGGNDRRMFTFKFSKPGLYPIELIQWDSQAGNAALLLVMARPGGRLDNDDPGHFYNMGGRFVGDVDQGGLRVWSELPGLSMAGVGKVTGAPGYSVTAGQSVTLTAQPDTGWTFVRWEGDVSGTDPSITVTPDRNLKVKPVFSTALQLTAGTGGTLTAVPALSRYEYGSVVRLEAEPSVGYGFQKFNSLNVAEVRNKTFTPATFTVTQANPAVSAVFVALEGTDQLSLGVNPVTGGYVQVTPARNLFKAGDSVTLTAVPAEGYLLDAWDGAASAGRTLTRTITIEGEAGSAQTVGASFVAGVRLNTSVEGRGSVTVTPSAALYYVGTPVTAKATPAYGARFVRWDGVGEGERDRSVALTSTSSLKAVFENMPDVSVAGSLVYWGRTDHPVSTLPLGEEYTQVSVGYDHAVALKADGTVVAWGNTVNGATTVPAGLNSVIQISAGNGFTLALKADGTVAQWPRPETGPVSGWDLKGLNDVVQVVAGNSFGMALKKDGTVTVLGGTVNLPWSDIISVATNPDPWNNVFIGLKRNGTVVAWTFSDWNVWGQTYVPNGLKDVTQVGRTSRTAFALKSDGSVVTWGSEYQLPAGLNGVSQVSTGYGHFYLTAANGENSSYGDIGWTALPSAAAKAVSISGGDRFGVGIRSHVGLVPNISGYEAPMVQLEVGDELMLGLGFEGKLVSRWQWQKASGFGDSTVWSPIVGQTSRRLRVASVGLEDSGRYRVVASNDNGSDVGPETSVVVIPSGTPAISVNGQVVQGNPGEVVSLRVGDAATVRLSTRMPNGQIRYTLDGSPPSFSSDEYSTQFNLDIGTHTIQAGVAPDGVTALLPGVTVKVEVVPTFSIATSIGQGEGTISVAPIKVRYLQGDAVTLKAVADPGFNFAGWTGVSAATTEVSLTVTENVVAKADFTPKPTYRILGLEQPSKSGWNVVRAVIESGSTATLESSLASALELLGKGSGEVAFYSETAPYIYYNARSGVDPGWFDGWEYRFPGDAKPRVGSEKKAALRATGFIEIPNPGSWTFMVRNSGAFRLKVGDQEFSMAGEDMWNNGRVFTAKMPKAGIYPVELVAWDTQEGSSLLMVMGRSGSRKDNDEDPGTFWNNGGRFLGDIDRGGLRVWSELPSLSIVGVGTVTGAVGYSVYSGEAATLTAEPATGWSFVRWEGDVSGTDPSITVTPDRNLKVKPVFSTALQLTAGTGGTLTAVPTLNRYEYGSVVRLEAEPSVGYWFQKFNSLNVTEVKNKTFTPATFTVTQANPAVSAVFVALEGTDQLSLRVNPVTGGYVQVTPAKNLFKAGESVTLTAVPAEGYLLDAWDGAASAGRTLTRTITIEGEAGSAQTVGASFVAGVRLNTSVEGRGSVTVTPSAALYYAGTPVTAKATPAYGSRFVRWDGVGEGTADRSVTLNATASLKAVFENLPDVPVAGSLVYWGRNDSSIASVPSGSDFVQVSIGDNHALALKVDGTVVAWGNANGNNNVTTVPAGLSGVKKVAAGNQQSLALKADGTLTYWGRSDWNQPGAAAAIRDAVDIAAGDAGSIVLKADGTVVGIGHADTIQWRDVVQIAAYPTDNVFLGLRRDGSVVAYQREGNDWTGRLPTSTNTLVFNSRDNVSVALSAGMAFAVKRDGSTVAWGQDWWGVKAYLQTATGVERIVGGNNHILIQTAAGTVVTFGDAPWNTPMPPGASTSFGVTAGQQASIGIVPIAGLAPEIVGNGPASVQLEVGDELVLGLGLETRNGSRWQWQKASGSGESTVWSTISGQTSRRLRNASVVSGDSGRYRLVASNDNGSDVGPEISVSVVPSGTPQITVNGVAVNGMPGETVRLRVGDRARVALSTRLEGGVIYYSTDGDDVTVASFEYTPTTDLDLGVGSYGIRAGVDAGSGEALVKGVALELEVVPTFAVTSQVAMGEGAVELSPNKARYLQGEAVGVVAKAAAGFEFAGWDGVSGAGATTEVQVSKDLTIGARFRTLPIFRITGTEAPSQAGWKVTRLVSAGTGTNSMTSGMASAVAAFSLPASSVQSFSEIANYINYRGSRPGVGVADWIPENRAYPGGSQAEGSSQVPFVVKASGYVEIPEPGSWTFGVVFSGPFRLKVGDSEWQGGWENWQDGRMSVIQIPRAGIYPIELLQWDQNPNEASLLLFARRGGLPGYDSDVSRFYNEGARFVGDVDRGGLRVWSELPGLDVAGVGRVTGSSSFSVTAGQSVQLTAEPATGWTFVRWAGDVSGTDPVLSLTPTSDLRIKPIFATTVALSVPNGNGTLAAIPASGPYEYGSKVRLQATPEAGFGFQRFTVNIPGLTGMNLTPTEITVNRPAIQVAASFVSLTATTPGFVALDLGTPSGGLVTVTPAKNLFNPGAAVSAKAVADPGWFFTGWESPVVSTQSQVQFFLPNTAGSVSEVRAKFVEGVALKALVSGRGRVLSNPPEAIHFPGSTVQLVAEAASGARFVRWQTAETLENPTSPNLSLVMSQMREVTAVFENDVNSREFGRLVGNGTSLAQSQVLPAGDDFVQVSLGSYHALALRLNGTVEAWGDNRFGQVTVPTGLSGVRSVVAGINYSLALKEDGSVVGWGLGVQGINLGILPRDITSMVAGASHVVFLRSNGLAMPMKLRGGALGSVPLVPAVIPPEFGYPLSVVDSADRGFTVRMFQASQSNGWLPNGNARAEAQIAGVLMNNVTVKPYDNIIDTSKAAFEPDGSYWEKKSIYYNQDFSGDRQFPGIPGKEGHTDNLAMEVVAWLELKSGKYSMVVNSDDSFRVSVGRDLSERLSWPYIGEFNAGRGASDTEFSFEVAEAGIYGFRLVYDEGNGGANCYWYVTGVPGSTNRLMTLINDDTDPSKHVVKAYRRVQVPPQIAGQAESVSQVAANIGTQSILFLKRDGTVAAYSDTDGFGQTTIPTGINDFVQVALSRTAAFGLRSNGKVVVWGTVDAQVKTAIEALPKVVSLAASGSQIWLYDQAGQVVSFMDDGNQPSQLLGAQGARIKSPQFHGVTALAVAPYSGFSPYVSGFTPSEFAVENGGRLFLGTGLVPESGSSLIWESSSSGLEGTWVSLSPESLTQTGLPVFDPITQAATGFYRWTARNGAGSLVGLPIRVVSRPAGSPVLLVDGVPYEQSGSAGVKVFGSSTVAVRSSAAEQTWKVNLSGTLAPVNLKSGETYSLGLGSFTLSAEATVAGVDLKSVELPLTVVPIFEVTTASGLIGGTFQLEVVDSEYTVPQGTGYRVGAGATVRATATPAYGYRIKSWKGFTVEASAALSFTVNSDRVVEPEFEAIPTFALTIIDGVDRGGSIFGVQPTLSELNATGNRLLQGSAVTLRADPRPGFVFKGWKIGGTPPMTSVENPLTLTVNADVSVEALFETTIAIQSGLAGGSIQSDLSSSVVTAGATGFFYAVPEAGKYLANWSIQEVVQNQIQVSQSFGYGGDTSRPLAPARFERASYRDTFQWTYDDLPGGATNGSPAMTVELSGIFYPPATSFYQFKIQSEGFGELWISPDAKPENLVRVAADGDNFPTVGMSSVAGDIAGLSTTSPRLSLKSGQGYYIRARLFKMAGQAGSVALTQGTSVLGDSMNWETDPMSAANFRLPGSNAGPLNQGGTAVVTADRPYQVGAVFENLPTGWTSVRAINTASASVALTPSVSLVGSGQTVKASVLVQNGFHFDRWMSPAGLSDVDAGQASIEVVAGDQPIVFQPRVVPETALLAVRTGQSTNQVLPEGSVFSVSFDRLDTEKWMQQVGLSSATVNQASSEAGSSSPSTASPSTSSPSTVPGTAGGWISSVLEQWLLALSNLLFKENPDSTVDVQLLGGPAGMLVIPTSGNGFEVKWTTAEVDGPSARNVLVRAKLRSSSGEVLAIQEIPLSIVVTEVNQTPLLARSDASSDTLVAAAGSVVEVPLNAVDQDLPAQGLESYILTSPSGASLHQGQSDLKSGGSVSFRWLASEGLGDRFELVTVGVRDSYGAESQSSFNIKVPAVPPTLTVSSPEAGIVTDERITVAGTASDNSGTVSVKLLRDGAFVANLPVVGGLFSYRLPDRLVNSSNRFTVVAVDASGNSTSIDRVVEWAPLRRPILGTLGSVKDGQELVVPLGLETPGDVSGMAFALTYDPTYLKSPQVIFKNSLPGAVVLANVDKLGEIRITLSSASGKTLPGGVADLADISFRARSVPDTVQTQIRAAIEDTSDARGRAHAFGNGNAVAPVEIRRRTYVADNNGNDLIDVGDAYLIQRKLVRLDPTEPWDVAQNDLNASDSIDSGDVTSVLRIVVDLDPVQTLAGANSIPASGPSAMLSRVVASGSLGGVSVEKRSAGFRIASGIAQSKSRTGVLTLRHSPAWVITQKSISVVGQGTGGALVSVATHLRDGQAFTKVSYLLSKEASSEGIVLEIQPDQGLELGGSISLRQWSYSRNGFDLINATVEQTELEFFVIPSVVESVSLVKTSDGFHLNLRGIPNVDYSIQASSDLLRWQEIQRHTANGEFQQLPVKADGLEAGFYRSVRAVANPAVSNK